jgi:hypothetical protein
VKRSAILSSVLALGLLLAACSTGAAAGAHHATSQRPAGTSDSAIQLRLAMRKLWEDHITWTRLYIVSAAAGLDDQKIAAGRLLKNQRDIGDAIKPYYGDAAGEKLTALLRQHILTAADLLTAAKAGDTTKVEKIKKSWYANGDQIAAFLSQANPTYWPRDIVGMHMRMHLDLTLEEAVARLQGRFADDVAAYDKVHEAILEMSDALSAGIIAQFSGRFTA